MSDISPLAYVAPWVSLGDGCVVHPFAVVGQMPCVSMALARQPARREVLTIGARTVICPHAVIYSGAEIGADCLIGDAASIREGVVIGARCVIGRHVTVLYDARIADDVRLFDGTHITGDCIIGAGSFFGPGVLTSNNRHVDLEHYHHPPSNPPAFGRRVMVGAGANILAGVLVGDGALIGIGAVVTHDVAPGARVHGERARERGEGSGAKGSGDTPVSLERATRDRGSGVTIGWCKPP